MNFLIELIVLFCTILSLSAELQLLESEIIKNEELEVIPSDFSKNLTYLKVENSTIECLENLDRYKYLEELIIENSQIEALNETYFKIESLKNLVHLSFVDCNVSSFELSRLKYSPSLKRLKLAGNPGIEIYGSAAWSKIRFLNLDNNNLLELPEGLKHMKYLQEISLIGNPIKFAHHYFSHFRQLRKVVLTSTCTMTPECLKGKDKCGCDYYLNDLRREPNLEQFTYKISNGTPRLVALPPVFFLVLFFIITF